MAENGDKYSAQVTQAQADALKQLEEIKSQIEAVIATVQDEPSDTDQ